MQADAIQIAKRAAAEMRAVGVISSDIESPRRDDIPAVSDPREFGEMADAGAEGDNGSPTVAPNGRLTQPLKLTYFDGCSAVALTRWILKGLIARNETSGWVAPPGAGKSALLTEISVHCAGLVDWRGHRAKEACGVVIFALERGDLFKRRLLAYQQRDGLHGLPIAIADAVIDLLNPACVETIVATVRVAEVNFGCAVGFIGIDTYAKGIAANGGDEDKARDQNRAAANLRGIHSRLENNVHIALVGHTGKDESRGARGSNAHIGDVDVMVQISGETVKTAAVIKGNDQPERVVAQFKLEPFELGRDEDGDPITTSIVSTDAIDTQPTQNLREPKLTANQKTLFAMLHDAGKSGLLTEDWNMMARAAGIGCHRRADLTDIRNALKSKGLVREMGDRWMVDH
jgi:AAA domain